MKRSTAKKGATLGAAALTSIVIPTMPSQAQSDQTQVRFLHAVAGAGPASLLVEKGGPRLPSRLRKAQWLPGLSSRTDAPPTYPERPVFAGRHRGRPPRPRQAHRGRRGHRQRRRPARVPGRRRRARKGHPPRDPRGVRGRQGRRPRGRQGRRVTAWASATPPAISPVPPGRHSVAVTRPGGEGGALVKAQVRAVTGTASSGFVVGSAGMPAQIVLTDDGTAGPVTAPATGLGGATSDGAWLLILGSSLIGGSLGGASYVLARRTRSRGALQVATPALSAGPPAPSSVAAGPPAGRREATSRRQHSEAPRRARGHRGARRVAAAAAGHSRRPLPPLPPRAPARPRPLESPPRPRPPLARARQGPRGQRPNGPSPSSANGHHGESRRRPARARALDAAARRALALPAAAPTGRFARTEPEDGAAAPAPPSFPRFIRPDPEPAPDTVPAGRPCRPATPTPRSRTRPAHAAALRRSRRWTPRRPRPSGRCRPGPRVPRPRPTRRCRPAQPEPSRRPRPTSPGPGPGSPSRRPPPEPPATFAPAPSPSRPEPEAEPVAEIVVEPDRGRRGARARRQSSRRSSSTPWRSSRPAPEVEQPEPSPAPEPETIRPCGPGAAAPAPGPQPPPARTVRTR